MRHRLLLTLCCVLASTKVVRPENEYEVKKQGVFPFMAVLYYPDETVVDVTGNRFLHGAVLIKPEWLLSAAIDHSTIDNVPLGFPRKSLLARVGALTFDPNSAVFEDEDEQEREVIQIVKPSSHNKESWWSTDITLLRTLLPFKPSSAVAPTSINPKRTYVDNNCFILFYSKRYGSTTEVKFLMQLGVELMPASNETCGAHFSPSTMTCAKHDPADDMKSVYDPDFCPGNSGGPLLCEGEVMALQTYIENNCKQPHLYQLLAPWDTLINCATEQKCNVKDETCNVCTSINKDDDPIANPTNNTQQEKIKETSGDGDNGPETISESSVLANKTLQHEPKQAESAEILIKKPPVLEQPYGTVSNETILSESKQIQTVPFNGSQASKPEQSLSSTSEKSLLLETSTKMDSSVTETTESFITNTTVSPQSQITVSTLSTLGWFAQNEIENPDQRRMDNSKGDLPDLTKQNTEPKSPKTNQTTKIKNWPKGKAVGAVGKQRKPTRKNLKKQPTLEKESPTLEKDSKSQKNVTEDMEQLPPKIKDGFKKKPQSPFSPDEKPKKKLPPTEALRIRPKDHVGESFTTYNSGSTNRRQIMTSLCLPLVILGFLM